MAERHLLEGAMQGMDEAVLQIFFVSEVRSLQKEFMESRVNQNIYLNQPAYLVDCSQMEVARQVD